LTANFQQIWTHVAQIAASDPGYMYDLQYDLPPRKDDDNCFELARTWINSCVHSHRWCARLQDTRLPSHVLDVGIHNSPRDLYLLESNGKCGRYVTLSHRWPPNLSLKTTSQSNDQHRQGIPPSRMPATFRDAMIVCRKLGIRYLWIDALVFSKAQTKIGPRKLHKWDLSIRTPSLLSRLWCEFA